MSHRPLRIALVRSARLIAIAIATTGLVALACATPSSAASPSAKVQSPLRVRWTEESLTPTAARVTAHIERLAPIALPLRVRLEFPAGVTLEAGRTDFVLDASASPGAVLEPFTLRFTHVPDGDVILRVEGSSDAMGFSSAVPYRFGRTPPARALVRPSAPGPVRSGVELGGSIPLDPPAVPRTDAPRHSD